MTHHFYPPPDPFVGGAQPLAPHPVNPSAEAVPVNNPPFSHPARWPAMMAIVLAWQPPPPDPFLGNLQPLAGRQLNPSITAVPVNNPPFDRRRPEPAAYQPWWPDPPKPQDPVKLVPIAQVAAFVPPRRDLPPPIAPDPLPVLRALLPPSITAVPVNPPPTYRLDIVSVRSWQPPPPDPFEGGFQPLAPHNLAPAFEAVPVNPPPPFVLDTVSQRAWQPEPPRPQDAARLVQAFIAPFVPAPRRLDPPSAAQDPLPTVPRLLPPSITAVAVNLPPPYVLETVVARAWIPPDPLPTIPPPLPPAVTAVAVNNPPFDRRRAEPTARQSWQPDPPKAQDPVKLAQPFIAPSVLPPRRIEVLQPVAPDPPIVIRAPLPASLMAVPVNLPPPYVLETVAARAWQIDAPRPQDPPRLVQPFISVSVPPKRLDLPWPSLPDPLPTLPASLAQGAPDRGYVPPPRRPDTPPTPDPLPVLRALLAPQLLAVAVNQPPPPPPEATLVLRAWVPPDPAPILGRFVPPLPPPVVNLPPPLVREMLAMRAWQPPDPAPVLRQRVFTLGPYLFRVLIQNDAIDIAGVVNESLGTGGVTGESIG